MVNTYEMALAEVYEILQYLPEYMRLKIPEKLLGIIKKEKDNNYKVNIKHPLNTKDYSKEAVVLLGMIYTDYLCSPEEKNKRKKSALESKQIYEKEISEKYSIDKLFKEKNEAINSIDNSKKKNNLSLVKANENWFTRIKKFFKKFIS